MEARELRIGNYLSHDDQWNYADHKGFFQWSDSDWFAVGECTLSFDNILPIPLTEEILLKCGFVKDETDQDKNIISGNICDYILESDNEGNYFLGVNHGENTLYFSWDIKHLHQLQNLYFDLTGKELEVKL